MAERGSKELEWSHGRSVVRRVHEKLEFVAFFERMRKPQVPQRGSIAKCAG
jgi:hypothetical protein